eukprot:1092734-Prymnesium_polylepis.2
MSFLTNLPQARICGSRHHQPHGPPHGLKVERDVAEVCAIDHRPAFELRAQPGVRVPPASRELVERRVQHAKGPAAAAAHGRLPEL